MVRTQLRVTLTRLVATAPAAVAISLTAGPAAAKPPDPPLKIPPDAKGYQTALAMMACWQRRDHRPVPAVAPPPTPAGTKAGMPTR
jgi:hypothetical protein